MLCNQLYNKYLINKSNTLFEKKVVSHTQINEYNKYGYQEQLFDPSKSSPPNDFMNKLQQRLNKYYKGDNNDE